MFCKRLNGKCQIKHAILPVAFLLLFISWVPLVTAGVGKDTVYPIYDIVVYGDSSGAVTAAIAAKRMGYSVVLVNPTNFLGGMSSSGLGATDFLGKKRFSSVAEQGYTVLYGECDSDLTRADFSGVKAS